MATTYNSGNLRDEEARVGGGNAHDGNTLHDEDELTRQQTVATIIGPTGAELSPEAHKRLFRQFGNPAPLGLCGFALTTFVLSMVNLQARSILEPNIVVGLSLFYGGLVQLLAGMWEMAVGNTFGATALSSYGGFWLSYSCIFIPGFDIQGAYNISADGGAQFYSAVGIYLIGWFIFTFLLVLCTLRSTVAFFTLFASLDITFLLLGVAYFDTANPTIIKAGGAFGLIAAIFAWYCALAGLVTKENSFFMIQTVPFPWSDKGTPGRHSTARNSASKEATSAKHK